MKGNACLVPTLDDLAEYACGSHFRRSTVCCWQWRGEDSVVYRSNNIIFNNNSVITYVVGDNVQEFISCLLPEMTALFPTYRHSPIFGTPLSVNAEIIFFFPSSYPGIFLY